MNGTITLAELSECYVYTAACLTAQIEELLGQKAALAGADLQAAELRLSCLRAMRRESREVALLLQNYYAPEGGSHGGN